MSDRDDLLGGKQAGKMRSHADSTRVMTERLQRAGYDRSEARKIAERSSESIHRKIDKSHGG